MKYTLKLKEESFAVANMAADICTALDVCDAFHAQIREADKTNNDVDFRRNVMAMLNGLPKR